MGRVRLGQGRVRSAAANLRRAADHWVGVVGKLLPGAELVMALALAGELEEAHEASDRCASVPSRTAELWLVEGRAWLAVAEGDLGAGRSLLDQAADHGLACGQRGLAARALHGLARIGHPEEALERLERITSETESPVIPAWVAHTSALVSRDPSALAAAASAFEHMGAMLVAAEASADAARAYRELGEIRRSTAAAQRAARLLDHCEGAMTPAVSGLDTLTPLTPREQEIALLAANGLPTKVIAARLFVSDRTVGNHLQRIYAKLGVNNRIELPGALGLDD
jgi:DNA-binding NarL/FixJ family response regulator